MLGARFPGRSRPSILAALCVLALASPSESKEGPDPSAFAGTWRLDSERSDSSAPMLAALEAPWIARLAMASFEPTVVVRTAGTGILVRTSTPRGEGRDRPMPGDGSERIGEDQLGRSFRESTRWGADGAMHVAREVDLKSGRTAQIDGIWRREGAALAITTVVRAGEDEPVQVRRIFHPVSKDGDEK